MSARASPMKGSSFTHRSEDGRPFPPPSPHNSPLKLSMQLRDGTDLESQLAMLKWRKIKNHSQIRQTLEVSHTMKQQDLERQMAVDRAAERQKWLESIVHDEL